MVPPMLLQCFWTDIAMVLVWCCYSPAMGLLQGGLFFFVYVCYDGDMYSNHARDLPSTTLTYYLKQRAFAILRHPDFVRYGFGTHWGVLYDRRLVS